MDNKNILNIGSIIADINLGTASKISRMIQEQKTDQDEENTHASQEVEIDDKGPIGDYEVAYQGLCLLLDDIKQKWSEEDPDNNLDNTYYQRDLLYLYDRITLYMDYLGAYPDRNSVWLEDLLELKYEIRNLL